MLCSWQTSRAPSGQDMQVIESNEACLPVKMRACEDSTALVCLTQELGRVAGCFVNQGAARLCREDAAAMQRPYNAGQSCALCSTVWNGLLKQHKCLHHMQLSQRRLWPALTHFHRESIAVLPSALWTRFCDSLQGRCSSHAAPSQCWDMLLKQHKSLHHNRVLLQRPGRDAGRILP